MKMNSNYMRSIDGMESDLKREIDRIFTRLSDSNKEAYRQQLISTVENNAEIARFADMYYGKQEPKGV